jgi:hypothetical protein
VIVEAGFTRHGQSSLNTATNQTLRTRGIRVTESAANDLQLKPADSARARLKFRIAPENGLARRIHGNREIAAACLN